MISHDGIGRTRVLAITAGALLASCHPEPEPSAPPAPAVFQFATVAEGTLDVSVRGADGPIAGAHLFVRGDDASASPPEDGKAAELLWEGMSGRDGHARGKLTSRLDVGHVLLVVAADGFTGPYDDESVRGAHGPFAPAAMVTVPLPDLAAYAIHLSPAGSAQ